MSRSASRRSSSIRVACRLLRLAAALAVVAAPLAARAAPTAWFASWEAPPQFAAPGTDFGGYTLRQTVHASIGGSQARIRISNLYGTAPLSVAAAHIAAMAGLATIDPRTDTAFTFGGLATVTVPPGAVAVSDPALFNVAPNSNCAVSMYTPVATGPATSNAVYSHPSFAAPGNQVSNAGLSNAFGSGAATYFLTGLDVAADPRSIGIVAIGDSITLGFGSTANTDTSWPNDLAQILIGRYGNLIGVADAGIGANKLLSDVAVANNQSALARIDRDVFSLPGVRQVILAEGINDINAAPNSATPSANDIIAGMQQVIGKAHELGIFVLGATITPSSGALGALTESKRQAVNAFVRTGGAFDLVLDFDAAVRDPANPTSLRAAYDSGDHLHPNSAGYLAMAQMYPLY